jgi:hypothetical protein
MSKAIRLGVIVALAMGTGLAGAGARADDAPSATDPAATQEATAATSGSTDDVYRPGAGGMEPQVTPAEGIDEEPGTAAHRAWVASIWSSP